MERLTRNPHYWFSTSNTAHFTPEVAVRTGLRIVTPHEFLAQCRLQP
jgi:hypothetical protein